LQTFVEVADAGGVSPAARRLGVSKSIVSRRLFRLEAELGIQLLARRGTEAWSLIDGDKAVTVHPQGRFKADNGAALAAAALLSEGLRAHGGALT
jgi:hypothetical protein